MDRFDKIRDIVHVMAVSGYASFYMEYIKKKLPEFLPEDIVCGLERLQEEGIILMRFEIRCPDDSTVLGMADHIADVAGTEIYCRECGQEICISEENICPKYFINRS